MDQLILESNNATLESNRAIVESNETTRDMNRQTQINGLITEFTTTVRLLP